MKTPQSNFQQQYQAEIAILIKNALSEDIGAGDFSALSCLPLEEISKAQLRVKEDCVLAGVSMAAQICALYDPSLELNVLYLDGDFVPKSGVCLELKGASQSILAVERLMLNCLQRMSGIATRTREWQSLIAHTSCKVLDTRKTTPNFRVAEKWAVAIGGGENHRMGLYDMVMLKDNHIDFCGGVAQAISRTQSYLKANHKPLPIVVECRDLAEVQTCLSVGGLHRLLLDNMSPDTLREAVKLIGGQLPTEASGNITKDSIVAVAETGVDYISMGALTYNVPIIDMSLKAVSL
ncbi:MAG: carboxylating nicotinate-nucleotide diphosphorylase [Flavobacteriia bacterium]|nr:carboxylating nicotinate-nucleotide diphosphorylase [Flavobacteriia bacterium]